MVRFSYEALGQILSGDLVLNAGLPRGTKVIRGGWDVNTDDHWLICHNPNFAEIPPHQQLPQVDIIVEQQAPPPPPVLRAITFRAAEAGLPNTL